MNVERSRYPFVPASLSASRAGAWELDLAADRLRFCPVMAAMLGLPETDGEHGISQEAFTRTVHAGDRDRLVAECTAVLQRGTGFALDYRVVPAQGSSIRVHSRGDCVRDAEGRVVKARGMMIDVTESRGAGVVDPAGQFDRVTDHALATRQAVDDLGAAGHGLRPVIDGFLLALGRQIAALRGKGGSD